MPKKSVSVWRGLPSQSLQPSVLKNHVSPEPPGNIYDGVAVVRACQRSEAFKGMVEDGEITRVKGVEIMRNLDGDELRFDPYEVQPLPWESSEGGTE